MDPLPALHPLVLEHIQSPPFQYNSARGLTFKGHARESIDVLKRWVKKRNKVTGLEKKKDWWLAQLHLHGITTTAKMTKADIMDALKAALSGGLSGPSEEILQLERELERKFLLANAVAREKEYASLSEEERIVKYSQRYLSGKFFSGTNDESLMIFWVHRGCHDGQKVHDAAANLGLHSANACGARERTLIVVGKNKVDVQNQVLDWENEYTEWRAKRRGARGRTLQE